MYHYFKLFIISCLVFLPVALIAQNANQPKLFHQLELFRQKNGDILYSAIFSLPETRSVFLETVGNNAWNSYLPDDLPNHLDRNQKTAVIQKIAEYLNLQSQNSQRRYLQHLSNWIITERQLKLLQQITSIEQTISALYQDPEIKKYFEPYLRQRGLSTENTDPEMAATTLSSAEIAEISYKVLNDFSVMNQQELLARFGNLYHLLYQDMGKW